MEERSIQKTGNMFYLYLPTNWCRNNKIGPAKKVNLSLNNDGSLTVSTVKKGEESNKLSLKITNNHIHAIRKLITACYINPLSEFDITFNQTPDIDDLLDTRKVTGIGLVDFDGKKVLFESTHTVNEPSEHLKTMVRQTRSLVYIMMKNYDKGLIARYEDEIDKDRLMIKKSVVALLKNITDSKMTNLELHYIEKISHDLERVVDHLILIPKVQIGFFKQIYAIADRLSIIFDEKTPPNLDYLSAMNFSDMVEGIEESKVKNQVAYEKIRVKNNLRSISEILMDWSISKEIDSTK